MTGELDNYYRARVESSLIRRRADELDLTTDYEVAVDTTIKQFGDARGAKYGLPAETHFFLTAAEDHRVMWLDNGVVVGIPNEQSIPVKRPDEE